MVFIKPASEIADGVNADTLPVKIADPKRILNPVIEI